MTDLEDFLKTLESEFQAHADPEIASGQKAYLKDQFDAFGIKTPERRAIQKPFLVKEYLPPKENLEPLVKMLWAKPQREFHYFAQELVEKYVRRQERDDLVLLTYMITHQSWWDTVDMIATKLVAKYFLKYPDERDVQVQAWLDSDHLWLQRTAILFQLHYKEKLDTEMLQHVITSLLGSREFFINKAIGWILRHYSRTNPEWVRAFVAETPLAPLSRREAMKYL